MITFKARDFYYTNGKDRVEGECLSTDTKPTTGIANGSCLIEMDTGDTYAFDETGAGTWRKLSSSGGGGSSLPAVTSDDNGDVLTVVNGAWDKASPSGGGSLIVTFTDGDEEGIVVANATVGAILSAYNAGTVVIGRYLDESLNDPVEYNMLAEALPYEGEIQAFRFYKMVIGEGVMTNIPIKTYEIMMEVQDESNNYGTLITNTFNAEFASNQ